MPIRPVLCLVLLAAVFLPGSSREVLAGVPPAASAALEITITGIRSDRGVIRLALCPPRAGFPDCDTHAVHSSALPIVNGTAHTILTGLAPGSYATSVFHDANGNGKLDTFAGIPREGYGFSQNPPFRPRAPRFAEAAMELAGRTSTVVRLRYIL